MRKPSFFHLSQPVGCDDFVARLCDGGEIPEFLVIQGIGVFPTLEEHSGHCRKVVLQTVVYAGQKTGAEGCLEHLAEELNRVAAA